MAKSKTTLAAVTATGKMMLQVTTLTWGRETSLEQFRVFIYDPARVAVQRKHATATAESRAVEQPPQLSVRSYAPSTCLTA